MRVFNVNKAIGHASSGVEYAQAYRRDVFAEIPWVDDHYVFTDYLSTNVSVFTDRLGYDRRRVHWIYNLVSGRETLPCTLTPDDVLAAFPPGRAATRSSGDGIDVAIPGTALRHRIRTVAGNRVDRVELWAGDQLLRVEHYDATLNNVEHFHRNRLARRVFLAPDGRPAAEQFWGDGEILRTRITPASPLYERPIRRGRGVGSFAGDVVLEGRPAFFRHVFERLLSRPDDVVIVDRALDVIDALYPVIGERRLYSIVHAEHYDPRQLEDGVLLWNNHYEHVFTHPDLVDAYIVSTRRQQEVLEEQLAARHPRDAFTVAHIPAGTAVPAAAPPEHTPFSLVTASRLADEKHIDVLIRAVGAARTRLPDVTLDIYGEGNRDRLIAAIDETRTQDCVRLRGHHDLRGLLGTYALYVSASTSEGFGLSLLEAIAEGLPIVGFDVDYGNREMVEPGVNGRLVPHTSTGRDVVALADAIVGVLTSGSLDRMRAGSLRRAAAYAPAAVRARWEELLGEGRC